MVAGIVGSLYNCAVEGGAVGGSEAVRGGAVGGSEAVRGGAMGGSEAVGGGCISNTVSSSLSRS